MELLFIVLALAAYLILTAFAWRQRDEATTKEFLPNPRPGAGCQCPDCDAIFTRPDIRNLHYMRKHADRRRLRS